MISNGIIKHALITRILTDTTNGMPYMICSQKGVKQNVIAISTRITLNSQVPNNNLIAGAGLDVFEKEPLPSTSPLYSVDPQKVVFTPHVAWGSVEARHRLILEVRENIIAFIKGEDRNNC